MAPPDRHASPHHHREPHHSLGLLLSPAAPTSPYRRNAQGGVVTLLSGSEYDRLSKLSHWPCSRQQSISQGRSKRRSPSRSWSRTISSHATSPRHFPDPRRPVYGHPDHRVVYVISAPEPYYSRDASQLLQYDDGHRPYHPVYQGSPYSARQ